MATTSTTSDHLSLSFKDHRRLAVLLSIFSAALVAANLIGSKVTVILGVSVSVGIFAYPLTFLITDIVSEVHGRKWAQNFVWGGLIAQLLVLVLILIALAMPASERFAIEAEYQEVFKQSARIIAASLTAFLVSQSLDVWVFHKIKERAKGRFLWLRNNLSTILSQLVDTMLFMYLAFWHAFPKMTTGFVFSLAMTYWGLKILFALIDTPFVYLGVRWLRGGKKDAALQK